MLICPPNSKFAQIEGILLGNFFFSDKAGGICILTGVKESVKTDSN